MKSSKPARSFDVIASRSPRTALSKRELNAVSDRTYAASARRSVPAVRAVSGEVPRDRAKRPTSTES